MPAFDELYQQRRVVIRFDDGFKLERERKALTERYGRIVLRPVFDAARTAIRRLQARAKKLNPEYSLPDFVNYHFLYLPLDREPEEVAGELRKRHRVAYVDAPTTSPNASTLKCSYSSRHIDGLGEGVNARDAWTYAGGKGDGQFLVDVERGWAPDHSRLPTSRIKSLVGKSFFGEKAHGTSVLGIVCGLHAAGGGCEGIAPNVASVGLASPVPDLNAPASQPRVRQDDPATDIRENIYDAIAIGMNELVQLYDSTPLDAQGVPQVGHGVLLLEQQTELGLPLETYAGIRDLLRLATGEYQITVVEAAGNAGVNLDARSDTQILQQHDSGAILVGSARKDVISQPPPDHHARFHSSNYGGRIDCYAWGECVTTPAWLSGQPGTSGVLDQCDDVFAETSAAAAIIAGVALAVQGIVANLGKEPLTAAALRGILANPELGTPCGLNEKIGVMPDLGRIAPKL